MKKIISKTYLTEGLQKLQYDDGSFDFLSGVYGWTDGDNFTELEKIGQVRLEKKNNFYRIEYYIYNEFRVMNYGSKMLKLLIKTFDLIK